MGRPVMCSGCLDCAAAIMLVVDAMLSDQALFGQTACVADLVRYVPIP